MVILAVATQGMGTTPRDRALQQWVLQEIAAAVAARGRAFTSPFAAAGRRDDTAGHGAPEQGELQTETEADPFAVLAWGLGRQDPSVGPGGVQGGDSWGARVDG